ncbi:POLRMT (predicted) [Pycnogonum litorale]
MTVVYGVTKFGGKLQIEKQLRDIPSFPKEYCHQGSSYLTSKTFESLGDMFSSTRKIQDWLTDSARLISQIRVSPIEWITPLGLPVRQPYHKQSSNIKVPGSTDSFSGKYSSAVDIHENPNTMKQKNAFPPNFVHSLDSTHMMLTSLFCQRAGITFASVHDCFWTHPDTVHIMNKICREQFVSLHKEPILQNLSDFLINKFGYSDGGMAVHMEILNMKLADVPKSGKFDLDGVLSSVYFFS